MPIFEIDYEQMERSWMAKIQGRRLSNQELADIPSTWENPRVDTRKYYQCVLTAWEVDQETYQIYKAAGGLCQAYKGKYYIA